MVKNVKMYLRTINTKAKSIDTDFSNFEQDARTIAEEFSRSIKSLGPLDSATLPPELYRLFADREYKNVGKIFGNALVQFKIKVISI